MSPDRDSRRPDDLDVDDRDERPRSLFSALWFRVLLAVLVLGVVAAVAVPYVLDTQMIKGPLAKSTASTPASTVTAPSATPAPPAPEPSAAAAPPAPSSSPAPAETAAPAATAAPETAAPSTPTARPKSEGTRAAAGKPAVTRPAKSPTMVAKGAESSRPAPKPEAPKATESSRAEAAKSPSKAEPAAPKGDTPKASAGKAATGGRGYWVQVGAFKDAETAKRVAARLREAGLRVEESTVTAGARAPAAPAAASADRYDVVVSGAPPADVEAKLAPKGLKGEATAGGVVVRPSLTLREAVALSRDLADAGLSVQVRRIGGAATGPPSAPSPAAGQTLHRVRVGGFADRAAAVDAMKQLEDKGFKPFIARGNE
jgi:DedD protein